MKYIGICAITSLVTLLAVYLWAKYSLSSQVKAYRKAVK